MHESSAPSLIPAAAEACTADLYAARSLTLIVHGVGDATSEGLLRAASAGYIGSDLGGISRRAVLTDCPTLTGGKGVNSLVIQTPGGSHFVVALAWAQRRTRLSAVAKSVAGLLLALTVVMTVTFVFRGTLEWLEQWLGSWTHRLVAYGVMTGLSFVIYLLRRNPTNREFKRPPMSYLFLPPLLLLGLMFFVGLSELFWIPVALLAVALWGMATVIVLRCLQIAPTPGWKTALIALILAMTLPSAAIVRIGMHSAMRTEQSYPSPDSPLRDVDLPPLPDGTIDPVEQPSVSEIPKEKKGAAADGNFDGRKPAVNGEANSAKNVRSKSPSTTDYLLQSDRDERADEEASKALLYGPNSSRNGVLNQEPLNIIDLVTGREFLARLVLAGICVVLCVLVMGFHWLLDFGFDVLHYGGNEKHRTSLIEALSKSIRWFHAQAPNAAIVVVGHSLGSVIAAQSIASMSAGDSWLSQVVLVTLGSPLNYINRVFPKSVQRVREFADVLRAAHVRWINLWRRSDPIGKVLDIGDFETVQYCVGPGGHLDYWSGGVVWKAVAFEALGIGARSPNQIIGAAEACVLERRLGLLVFACIAVLALCGVGLWDLFP
jgi:hypothetical protein